MILGIDLGTTNSVAAIWRDGQSEIISNSLGHRLTPSAVSVGDDGAFVVGLAARERQSTHPDQTATLFKRSMGVQTQIQLGRRKFLPEELSALVLGKLKADAEAFLGQPVTEAVITVPAYFSDKQRKATRRAGELAGLKVERLLNEPTAAALAYGMHRLDRDAKYLVFDLGGGTFDVSVLEIFDGTVEVRASAGDNRLGGEDFNALLARDMTARMGEAKPRSSAERDVFLQSLRSKAERVKRALSDEAEASVELIRDGESFQYDLTAERFEELAEPLLARLRAPVLRALQDSRIKADEIDEIVLVGGATRMPIVRRAVTRMFGRFSSININPDEAVALGAAIQAGLKVRDAALKEVVLTDVSPFTLGVEVSERREGNVLEKGLFAPIIERNQTIPISREKSFSTVQNLQPGIRFNIYQGESLEVKNNILLGKIDIPVPPAPAGGVNVSCRFTYDINGLLEVDLHVQETGERRQLVIVDEEGLSGDELAQRREILAALKVHPRDLEVNLAAMARAMRCYEDNLGDRRAMVGQLISQLRAILDTQDERQIAPVRAFVLERLDQLEGETFL